MSRPILAVCAALLAVLAPSTAEAARVAAATPATGTATIVHPLTLLNTASLDFGRLIVGGAGTAVIDPDANTEAVTGGVTMAGGSPHAASFTGAAAGLSLIIVGQPAGPITLTRAGGTETMTVTNFKLQNGNQIFGNAIVYIATAAGAFTFRVGGQLNVAAAQADGTYTGTFTVTATYF